MKLWLFAIFVPSRPPKGLPEQSDGNPLGRIFYLALHFLKSENGEIE